jgi:uncharacterized protein YyaL (SSP411 family)
MSGRTKPPRRRKYTMRAAADGLSTSRRFTTRLTTAETQRILQPCHKALQAMRTASASYDQWVVLCTAGHMAEAIEDGRIITGQRDIIELANTVLHHIGQRCGTTAEHWTAAACYSHELNALADLVAAHSRQVHELTYKEYTRAADKAVARVFTDGGQVFRMETTAP